MLAITQLIYPLALDRVSPQPGRRVVVGVVNFWGTGAGFQLLPRRRASSPDTTASDEHRNTSRSISRGLR